MVEIAQHKPITKAQIKSIHVALSRHGIDDDTYRAKLDAMFGVSSCKQLSRRDASTLLRSMGCKLQNRPGHFPPRHSTAINNGNADNARSNNLPPKSKKLPAGIVSLPSPAQRRFIDDLAGEIEWRVANGYQYWLQKSMSLNRVATAEQARRVIEGLKALKTHQADK